MNEQRCALCGSDAISLWMGGSLGVLYHCTNCLYTGPLIVRIETRQSLGKQIMASGAIVEVGNFWSETGIGNRSLF